jgi:hypothetical protein
MALYKFIVMGSWCEYSAHLHVIAETEEQALQAWEQEFTSREKAAMIPKATQLSTKFPQLLDCWKGHGHRSYSGGYDYFT